MKNTDAETTDGSLLEKIEAELWFWAIIALAFGLSYVVFP